VLDLRGGSSDHIADAWEETSNDLGTIENGASMRAEIQE